MDPGNAVEIRGLRKSFKVRVETPDPSRRRTVRSTRVNTVIDGIDLDIRKGETLGVIGGNGAGKSTLLKLITGILEPDGGTIEVDGRMASILELGMGFHYDLSGLDNIEIMCGYHGLDRRRAAEALPRILEYSGLGDAVYMPLRTYSSGMTARLAMAILVCVDADVMIVDEVLSVGDAGFSAKSQGHFSQLIASGRTVILTSHRIRTIESGSDRVVWLDGGRIRMIGDPHEVCRAYTAEMTGTDEAVRSLAESGDPGSQYRLAKRTESDDPEGARRLMESSASSGWAPALREAGMARAASGDIEGGLGMLRESAARRDRDAQAPSAYLEAGMEDEARRLEEALGGEGGPARTYNLAMVVLMQGYARVPEAVGLLEEAWAAGNGDAGYRLAVMRLRGSGIPMDVAGGLELMEAAAERGHFRARQDLARMYLDGDVVERDPERAFRWNLSAARSGDRASQFRVACMYRDGSGTDADPEQARAWFAAYVRSTYLDQYMAASRSPGETGGEFAGLAATTFNGRAVARAEEAGVRGAKRDVGDLDDRGRLREASRLRSGKGAERDPRRAFEILSDMASSGNADAMMMLAQMWKDGEHAEADEEMYRKLVREAAELGNRRAQEVVDRWARRNERRRKKRAAG